MRLLLFTVGTLGDLLPLVALGGRLKEAGHDVRVCTHGRHREPVEAAGLGFEDHDAADPREQMAALASAPVPGRAGGAGRWGRATGPAPRQEPLERLVALLRGSDAFLTGYASVWHAAAATGTPMAFLGLYPLHPTGDFPHALTRFGGSWGRWGNRATHRLVAQYFWRRERPWMNAWRARLGLPARPWWGGPMPPARLRTPCFYGFSEMVIPRPADWPEGAEVTGYWFPEAAVDGRPDPELVAFLADGPPPVVVSFGSLVESDPGRLLGRVRQATRDLGRRLVVLAGWQGDIGLGMAGDTWVCRKFVPLSWILPRAAAFVHHAGAGTVAETLRAGVPSLALPRSGEQRFWARRQHRLGVSPPPLDRDRLEAGRLRMALEEALGNAGMERERRRVKAALAAEDGPGRAVAAIHRWLEKVGRR
ncbi:MAG: glycosyltransferase [Verrucomicrobiota bacterium]